jgi:hypothetical protein
LHRALDFNGNLISHPKGTKTEGKRPFGGLTRRWEDNIKMDVKDMGCEVVEWVHLAQHKVQ